MQPEEIYKEICQTNYHNQDKIKQRNYFKILKDLGVDRA